MTRSPGRTLFQEQAAELAGIHTAVAQDRLIMSTNDQSGISCSSAPPGMDAGPLSMRVVCGRRDRSAYTQVDEVRFRIIETSKPS